MGKRFLSGPNYSGSIDPNKPAAAIPSIIPKVLLRNRPSQAREGIISLYKASSAGRITSLSRTQNPAAKGTTAQQKRGVLAATCCAVLFLYAVYLGALSVLLPFIAATFRLGPAASGRLFPASFLGFVAGVLACGYLSDRWGRKAVLLGGIAVYGAGLFLFGSAPTFTLALLASALIGVGSGAMETVASALASDLFPERRAFILNATQIAFGAGAAFSPTLAHRLLTAGTDWRTLYLGLAAVTALLFVALAAQPVARARHGAEALDFAVLRRVLWQPAFVALCLAQALYVGAEVGFFSWMPTYFQHLPQGAAWKGIVVTVFWVAMTGGRIVSGALVGRVALVRLILLLSVAAAVSSTLALLWTSPLVVLGFVAVTGLCFSGIFSLILAEAGERYPQNAGTVFGGVIAVGGLGGVVVPWSVGALAATSLGWQGALGLVPVAALGVGAVMLWLERN